MSAIHLSDDPNGDPGAALGRLGNRSAGHVVASRSGPGGTVGALCGPVGSVASSGSWSVAVHGWLAGIDDPAAWLVDRLARGGWPFDDMVGEFAIVAIDHRRAEYHLIRDQTGTRPLYYRRQGSVAASTELRALVDGYGDPLDSTALDSTALDSTALDTASLDTAALRRYLGRGNFGLGGTPYRSIGSVPPAHHIVLRRGFTSMSRWWWPSMAATTPQGLVQQIERALEDRLALAASCDVQLSGGLDSSVLACLAARQSRTSIELVGLEGTTPGSDERRYQAAVAESLALPFHRFDVDAPVRDLVQEATDTATIPLPPNGAMWRSLVAQRADSNWLMVSGSGGDEVFGRLPVDGAVLATTPSHWPMLCSKSARSLAIAGARNYLGSSIDRRLQHPSWVAGSATVRPAIRTTPRGLALLRRAELFIGPVNSMVSEFDDLAFSRSGLFLTTPFFDRRVIEAALGLDPMLRNDPDDWRALQRTVFCDVLPPTVAARTSKAHFGDVYDAAVRQHRSLLEPGRSEQRGLCVDGGVDRVRLELERGTPMDRQAVWRLVATEAFLASISAQSERLT